MLLKKKEGEVVPQTDSKVALHAGSFVRDGIQPGDFGDDLFLFGSCEFISVRAYE